MKPKLYLSLLPRYTGSVTKSKTTKLLSPQSKGPPSNFAVKLIMLKEDLTQLLFTNRIILTLVVLSQYPHVTDDDDDDDKQANNVT